MNVFDEKEIEIIIKGERRSGKSTTAALIKAAIEEYTNKWNVVIKERNKDAEYDTNVMCSRMKTMISEKRVIKGNKKIKINVEG
jgi:hypothetical protein